MNLLRDANPPSDLSCPNGTPCHTPISPYRAPCLNTRSQPHLPQPEPSNQPSTRRPRVRRNRTGTVGQPAGLKPSASRQSRTYTAVCCPRYSQTSLQHASGSPKPHTSPLFLRRTQRACPAAHVRLGSCHLGCAQACDSTDWATSAHLGPRATHLGPRATHRCCLSSPVSRQREPTSALHSPLSLGEHSPRTR